MGENGEITDVVGEFLNDIKGAKECIEGDDAVQESVISSSPSTTVEDLVERSDVIMDEERHIKLQQEQTQHLLERRGSSA